MKPLRIRIVGGSLAGLFAGVLLQRDGHDVCKGGGGEDYVGAPSMNATLPDPTTSAVVRQRGRPIGGAAF
jgi:thioredoxin reductase